MGCNSFRLWILTINRLDLNQFGTSKPINTKIPLKDLKVKKKAEHKGNMHQNILGSLVVTLISHLQCDIFYILKLQESTQVHATGCTFR